MWIRHGASRQSAGDRRTRHYRHHLEFQHQDKTGYPVSRPPAPTPPTRSRCPSRDGSPRRRPLALCALVGGLVAAAMSGCGDIRAGASGDDRIIATYLDACHARTDGMAPITETTALPILTACAHASRDAASAAFACEAAARILDAIAMAPPATGLCHGPLLREAAGILRRVPDGYPAATLDALAFAGAPTSASETVAVAEARTLLVALSPPPRSTTSVSMPHDGTMAPRAPAWYWYARLLLANDRVLEQSRPALEQFFTTCRESPFTEHMATLQGQWTQLHDYLPTALSGLVRTRMLEEALLQAIVAMTSYDEDETLADAQRSYAILYTLAAASAPDARTQRTNWYLVPPLGGQPVFSQKRADRLTANRLGVASAHMEQRWEIMAQHLAQALRDAGDAGIHLDVIDHEATFIPYCRERFRAEIRTLVSTSVTALTDWQLQRAMGMVESGVRTIAGEAFLSDAEAEDLHALAVAALLSRRQRHRELGHVALAQMTNELLIAFAPEHRDAENHPDDLRARIAARPRLRVCLEKGVGWEGVLLDDALLQEVAALGTMYCPELAFTSDASAAERTVAIDLTVLALIDPTQGRTGEHQVGSFIPDYGYEPAAAATGSVTTLAGADYPCPAQGLGPARDPHILDMHPRLEQEHSHGAEVVRMGVRSRFALRISGGKSPAVIPCGVDDAAYDLVQDGRSTLVDLRGQAYSMDDWAAFLRDSREELAMKITDAVLATRPGPDLATPELTDELAEEMGLCLYARSRDCATLSKTFWRLGAFDMARPVMPAVSAGYTWPLPYEPLGGIPATATGGYLIEGPGLHVVGVGAGTRGMVVSVAPTGFVPIIGAVYLVRVLAEGGRPFATWPALLHGFEPRSGAMSFGLLGQPVGLATAKPPTDLPVLDQPVILRAYAQRPGPGTGPLVEVRAVVSALGGASARDVGWAAQISEPGSGTPPIALAYDLQGRFLGVGEIDARTGSARFPPWTAIAALVASTEHFQRGW